MDTNVFLFKSAYWAQMAKRVAADDNKWDPMLLTVVGNKVTVEDEKLITPFREYVQQYFAQQLL